MRAGQEFGHICRQLKIINWLDEYNAEEVVLLGPSFTLNPVHAAMAQSEEPE